METIHYVIIGAGALAFILFVWFIALYNGLVKWRNVAKNAWAQIDVQLKRRFDLIPNLVEIVKGYATHERELFENIAKARSAALGAKSPKEVEAAENQFVPAMRSLFAVVENYPQLKADQNFRSLMEELVSTENKVAFARQYYNDSVQVFNTKTQQFPSIFVANMFSFQQMDFLQVPEFEKEVQKVKFT